jgi:hypothetical protein
MSNDLEYEKQAQSYHAKTPLIVLGSGASAAFGLPGMQKLGELIVEKITASGLDKEDKGTWDNFCALLRMKRGLEAALIEGSLSVAMTRRVVLATWDIINEADLALFQRCIARQESLPLGLLLKQIFRTTVNTVNIITTNYDRLAEYACEQHRIHHYTGFTYGYYRHVSSPESFRINKQVHIWKVHGSLDWFYHSQDDNITIGLPNLDIIPDNFEPQIVTPGVHKYQRTHLEPYREVIRRADIAVKNAGSYLCIGYGFNDEHIQPKILEKCLDQDTPITIVTQSISESVKELIIKGRMRNYLVIERGADDNHSIIYSSTSKEKPLVVEKNLWSLEGYMTLII